MDYSYNPEFIVAEPSTKFRLVRNVVIVLLLAIVAARAFGAVQLDYFSAETTLIHTVGQIVEKDGGKTGSLVERSSDTRATSTDSVWRYGIGKPEAAIDRSALAADIADKIRRTPIVGNLNIVVDRLELSGAMWMPLRKSGSGNFTVSISGSEIGSIVVSGTVETTVSGPATSHTVERLIADKITIAVAGVVADRMKAATKKT